ncbi:hypothetical protein ZEAMMB73_Zm00001d045106 [Zea mays]|uniref:Uncharacterized protein n=1 Tax=Zea mays TaxID=4577 RepID=A0A1D6NTN3_MAIZE|nr:hypothetical protein ZEAMMB73_Zm00001d045106 [Zea mays]
MLVPGILVTIYTYCFRMAAEDSKDILKKRLPKKIREVPDCYFLPRRSWPSALAIYGAVCAASFGAGMLLEVWINKKIKEDSGIVWEMDK